MSFFGKDKNSESEWKYKSEPGLMVGSIGACLVALAVIVMVGFSLWTKAPATETAGLKQQATPTPAAGRELSGGYDTQIDVPISKAEPGYTAIPRTTQEPGFRKADTYTMLVVGRDRVGMNTDTIMVARMDCKEGILDVVSIPRDTLVNVPWYVKKVNSILGATDIDGLVEHVENLVGFDIDNYVIFNTFVFQELIDCIGGVYFDVPIYMDYDAPDQGLSIHLSPGYQLLNGDQAEQVVRFRQNNDGSGYSTGDLGRIETQHAFLEALSKQVLSLGNITNLPQMINIVLENTDTDLTNGNIAFYAQEFLKLDSENIHFYTIPHENVYIRGGSYISIKLDEWLEMVNDCLNPFTVKVTEANVDVLSADPQGNFYSTTGSVPDINTFYDYFGLN